MDVSLAQLAELTCPACKRTFSADLWLIVDGAARPDLLQRARAGTLHDLACPHCGNEGAVDTPLLLYRPGEEPALLFSPARTTSSEEDREQATGLVDALQERLGDRWRDEWLAEGLPSVLRDLLPAALGESAEAAMEKVSAQVEQQMERLREEDPEARAMLEEIQRQMEEHPLLQAVQTLSEARSTKEVLEVVQAHPILLSDEADAMLQQSIANARRVGEAGMARHIEERYQILRQIREQGLDQQQLAALAEAQEQMATALAGLPEHLQRVMADVSSQEELDAALEAHPELREALAQVAQRTTSGPAIPEQFQTDLHQAQAGLQRYLQTGNLPALNEAVVAWERILNHPAFSQADEHFRLATWNNAGIAYLRRYEATGNLENLDTATNLWKQAIAHTPEGSPDWARWQGNLGVALWRRFEALGQVADLDAAIAAYQKALDVAREGSPDWARWQGNLGVALRTRFEALSPGGHRL